MIKPRTSVATLDYYSLFHLINRTVVPEGVVNEPSHALNAIDIAVRSALFPVAAGVMTALSRDMLMNFRHEPSSNATALYAISY